MKIAYISKYESIDIKNWSGTEYFIARSLLQANNDLSYITNLEEKLDILTRLKYQYNRRKGLKYFLNRSPYVTKQYAKQVEQRLDKSADVIFSPGTIPIAHLDTKQPKVFYTDATFASMIGYYDWFENISKATIREGMKLDQIAMDSSALAIFASDWAAESAIRDYGADPSKVKVVPLGANLENEKTFSEIKSAISNRSTNVCKILFIGVDWERKGGQLVLDSVAELNKGGLATELHIVGIPELPISELPSFVINHGFISKKTSEGQKAIEDLLLDCHFLFVPSKAEAYGVVFCEASAYGLPSIATKTGGIPTIIKDNINGITLGLDEPHMSYAKFIHDTFINYSLYKELALSSFNEYESRLNWRVAGQQLTKYMSEI